MITKQLGDYSGEMSLMGSERHSVTIAKVAELLAFEVSGTAFQYILEQQPAFLKNEVRIPIEDRLSVWKQLRVPESSGSAKHPRIY